MHDIREINRPTSPWLTTQSFDTLPGCPTRYCVSGELGYRLTRNIERIERQVPYSSQYLLSQISDADACWCNFPRFHGDMAGRWILAETHIHADGQAPPHLSKLVADLIQLQNKDGSFGSVAWVEDQLNPEKAYGNGWMLKALAQYALTFHDAAVINAAVRLGECYLSIAEAWDASGERESAEHGYASTVSCFYHALDGVMTLFQLTDDPRFLEFAGRMTRHITPLDEADHSHMYLTIRRGLLHYYQTTDNTAGIAALEEELDVFHDRWVMETGGIPERLIKPDNMWELQDEGCSLFDWHLLALAMHRATGHERWLCRAVFNLENQVFFNQTYNGGFGSVIMDGMYPQMGKEAPWCCSLFGPYGMISGAAYFVALDGDTLTLYVAQPGNYIFGKQLVTIDRDDASGTLTIDVNNAPAIKHVKVATPFWLSWQDEPNNATDDAITYRDLAVTDNRRVELSYAYRIWASRPKRPPQWWGNAQQNDVVNLFLGPWLLAHRHHPPKGAAALNIHASVVDGFIEPQAMQYLFGLPGSGESFQVTFKTDHEPDKITTFRWPNQDPCDVFMYALKECESPGHGSLAVTLGGVAASAAGA